MEKRTYSLNEAIEIGGVISGIIPAITEFESAHTVHKVEKERDSSPSQQREVANNLFRVLGSYETICRRFPELIENLPKELLKKVEYAERALDERYTFV